ncbi:hypothetical protein SEA_KINGBOB_59 [Arthrobacter phage KingBob]|uniref:Uncharacterized protein n=1 Tax=Arthrobacter phage Sergei TaxID=2250416 RepID=A0A345KPZ7_9CAUD|nr:hypothetical protein KDJ06_gp59 [Arthrobacter phage Sergei]ASZ74373.1 hypothetical protein TEMPER16_59 [Arthrobacter phage Temper16]AXH43986.1 hypothetical protein SEA_DAIBOJU_59 [Arthrobacter phage Daiboju]AXH44048.1 hypothetical protein SEA_HERB_59 [Arthrobacter phage Herb]AXH44292.1 hypothetical protein SEA_KINGBOB_59 [Arthrobacter phage KingBob]QGJ97199.1 hypothetical protein SEA_MARIA1952_58 [Arthrobacter phage Maria1952]
MMGLGGDLLYCWEDDTTGCICGNECDPPAWIIKMWEAEEGLQKAEQEEAQTKTRPVLPHTFGRDDPADLNLNRAERRALTKLGRKRGRPYRVGL